LEFGLEDVVGEDFTIAVVVENVSNLYGFDILFSWDTRYLGYVDHTATIPVEDYPDPVDPSPHPGILHGGILWVANTVDETAGTYNLIVSSMDIPLPPVFNGNGTVFTMTLNITSQPTADLEVALHLEATDLADNSSPAQPIPHTTQDGLVAFHAEAKPPTANFTYHPDFPLVDQMVIFNASGTTPNGGDLTSFEWDFGDDTSPAMENDPIANHSYTAPGTYNVTLTVADSEGLSDTIWHAVVVYAHDISVVSVTRSPAQVFEGKSVNITVVVRNNGDFAETFNVTAFANTTEIQTLTVSDLAPEDQITLTFFWNTTGVLLGNYIIKAEASTVPEEISTADNIRIDDVVRISGAYRPPAISILSPENRSYNTLSLPLVATLNESTSWIGYSLDDEANETVYENMTLNLLPEGLLWINTTLTSLSEGRHWITVYANDTDGHMGHSDTVYFTIDTTPPKALFSYSPTVPVVDQEVYFNASDSYDDEGPLVRYEWNFGDDTDGVGRTVEHVYTEVGNFTVVLTVEDAAGNVDTEIAIITVEEAGISAPLWIVLVVVASGVVLAFVIYSLKSLEEV
jgi:PKD repeat protein